MLFRAWRRQLVATAAALGISVSIAWAQETESRLHDAIRASADYLVRSNQPDGQFRYRVNLDPEVVVQERYNLLRHAGAMYSMAQYYEWRQDKHVLGAIKRAGQFLRTCCIAPLPDNDELLAVWSRPEITRSGKPLQAKLGGTGLGLVALVGLERVSPGSIPLEHLRRLAKFVIYMQKPDGSFYSKYVPSKGGRNDEWTSHFYPGEAALGLLMLYELDSSPAWLEAATQALGYLAYSRGSKRRVKVDHWALIATAQLFSVRDEEPLPKEQLLRYAIKICQRIATEQLVSPSHGVLRGSFSSYGKTTPAATRLEGLLAALNVLPPEERKLHEQLLVSARLGIDFLLRAQVSSGEHAGGMPRAIRRLPNSAPRSKFNTRATEIRIDYVQHAMSAMIEYARVKSARDADRVARAGGESQPSPEVETRNTPPNVRE